MECDSDFNAKDAEGFAKERREGFPLRPLRRTLRPLRLGLVSFSLEVILLSRPVRLMA
jgi:hypothetical protein